MLLSLQLGLLAASGLLFGAIIGVFFNPNKKLIAGIMAFGSGALISAVAFELVQESFEKSGVFPLLIGIITGGTLFVIGNQIIENMGGFLRNTSNQKRFLHKQKRKLAIQLIDNLSKIDIFRSLPPEEMHHIVPFVQLYTYQPGQVVFEQGTEGDALYLIESGEVSIYKTHQDGNKSNVVTLSPGQTFGEMALLTQEKRSATAKSVTETKVYRIKKHDFERILIHSPRLANEVSRLLAKRLSSTTEKQSISEYEAEQWKEVALKHSEDKPLGYIEEKHIINSGMSKSASFAIFLGALIDGIPESVVIGITTVAGVVPNTAFIVAVFLSNFPEAMSSASGMIKNKFSKTFIFSLWASLVLVSGLASFFSNMLLLNSPNWVIAGADAIAAGGILAMLANTMMPEAFELGGTIVSLSTIAGFMCSFLLSVL